MRTLATVVLGASLALVSPMAIADDPTEPARQQHEPSIVGEWWTEDRDGRIQFVRHVDGTYRGIVSWGSRPRQDCSNPDPKLRDRPILGMTLIWDLVDIEGRYEGGYVYNPNDGRTYRVSATLNGSSSLKLRGYLGIPLLGQTQNFTRYR